MMVVFNTDYNGKYFLHIQFYNTPPNFQIEFENLFKTKVLRQKKV